MDCLRYERELEEEEEAGNDVELIYCRIVGYLFHHYPTDRALKTIISEVLSCTNREQFLLLGEMYYSHFVRAFRSNKGRIPTPSSHASRPSFDRLADMVKAAIEETPSSHGSAKRKPWFVTDSDALLQAYMITQHTGSLSPLNQEFCKFQFKTLGTHL